MIKFSATLAMQYDSIFSPFSALEFDAGLEWLTESGIPCVEVCISNYNDVDVNMIKDKLDKLGLACSTISTGQAYAIEGLSLTDKSPDVRKATQKRVNEHVRAAMILSSHVTIGLLRGGRDSKQSRCQIELLSETLIPCAEFARDNGVTLLLEPINRYETSLLNSAKETVAFIDALGISESVGILWDTFHANIEDEHIGKTIDLIASKLKHVHFADSNRHFPGFGHLNFEFIYKCLCEIGFSGCISFECMNIPSAEYVKMNAAVFSERLQTIKSES